MAQSRIIHSFSLHGITAMQVDVEAVVTYGPPSFATIGLTETAAKETRDRVRCAIESTGLTYPPDRIVVSAGPPNFRKSTAALDLAAALAILEASGQLPEGSTDKILVFGELALSGKLRPVRGAVAAAELAASLGLDVICPFLSAEEAAAVPGVRVLPAETLTDVVEHLRGNKLIRPYQPRQVDPSTRPAPDLTEIAGNSSAKTALMVAAAGGHSVLLIGPPGASKTMLARRLPGILPEMSEAERLDVLRVYSAAGLIQPFVPLPSARPFRAPHHSISDVGLLGGGLIPRPGEVSLAHRGVLLLDEVTEFRRSTLEGLKNALKHRTVRLDRAGQFAQLPCHFQLIATMDPTAPYFRPLSPDLAAMFDIVVPMLPVSEDAPWSGLGPSNVEARARVEAARAKLGDSPSVAETMRALDLDLDAEVWSTTAAATALIAPHLARR